MKFTLLSIVSFGLGAAALAQTPVAPTTTSADTAAPQPTVTAPAAAAVPDGYCMTNGVMYVIRNGRAMPLEQEVTFRITKTGVIGFDGKPVIIPEGHMLANDGRFIPIPTAAPATTAPVSVTTDPATRDIVVPPAYPRVKANDDPTSPGPDRIRPNNDPTRPGTDRERAARRDDPTRPGIDGQKANNDPTRPGTDRERAARRDDPTRPGIDGDKAKNDPTSPGTDRERIERRNDPTLPGADRK